MTKSTSSTGPGTGSRLCAAATAASSKNKSCYGSILQIGGLSDAPIRDNRSTGPIVDLHLQAVLHQSVPRRFSRDPAVQIPPFVYGFRVQSAQVKHLRSPIALRSAKRLYHACTQVGAIELPCYPRRIVYTVRCQRIKIPGKEVPDRLVFLEQSGSARPDRRVLVI